MAREWSTGSSSRANATESTTSPGAPVIRDRELLGIPLEDGYRL